jgi:glycosyltransferase 2 family protein
LLRTLLDIINEANYKPAVLLGLLTGTLCFIWFAQDIDWGLLWNEIKVIHLGWLCLAILILLIEFVIRAIRWKILLRPMGKETRLIDLFSAQVIGACLNTILPLRFGEIAKPLVAAKRTGHTFIAVTATSIMERVYDLLGMVSVLVFMVIFLGPDPQTSSENQVLVSNLKLYGAIFGAIASIAMAVFFLLASREQQSRHIFVRIVSISPQPIQNLFLRLFDGFVEGLANTQDKKGLWQAAVLSVWMWINGALAIFCLFKAFELSLPFGAACFMGVAIALTVALPQAPGFIGVFHVAIEKTLLLWGQSVIVSKGFALVFWTVSFVPITVIGFLFLYREGLSWNEFKNKALQLNE